ncbi:MAG: hypothetical protein AMXMBFR84_36600 [Candidatus Hydrogenedentota bacterium]
MEQSVCLGIIAISAALLLYPAILGEATPVSLSPIFSWAPWQDATPDSLRPSVADRATDPAQKFLPWYVFLNTAGFSEDIFWNPYEAGGVPFFALWRTRCLSPFSLPFYVFDPFMALSISLFAKLLVAGASAFYAAKRFGFATSMALFVGLTFQLSAPLVFWSVWPLADVMPWFPLLVIFCERLALGHYRTWPLGALTLVLMLLGGDPESVLMLLAFGACSLVVRAVMTRSGAGSLLGAVSTLIGTLFLALCAMALQAGPFLEWLREAASTGRPEALTSPGLSDLSALLFAPYMSLSNSWEAWRGHTLVVSLLHAGLVSTWMLVLWISLRRLAHVGERRRIEPLLFSTLLFTVLGLVVYPVLRSLPPLAWLNPEHFLLTNGFILAIAAAATGEEWLQLKADGCSETLKRFGVRLAVVVALAGVLAAMNFGDNSWGLEVGLGVVLLAGLLALIGATLLYPSIRVLGYGMSVLAFLNLYPLASLNMPWSERDAFFPNTEFVSSLEETGSRLSGSEGLAQWPLTAHFIAQFHAFSGTQTKRHALFESALAHDALLSRRTGSPYLLLTQADIQGAFAQIRPHLRIKHVFSSGAVLFEDPEGYPRTWLASSVQAVDSPDATKIAWEAPPLMEHVEVPFAPAEAPGVAHIESPETHTRLKVNVDSTAPGLLVLADSWYPGWTAKVNDVETEVLPVDAMFRGVVTPAGKSSVVFEYAPNSLESWAVVSLLSWLIILAGIVYLLPGAIRRIRQQSSWSWIE